MKATNNVVWVIVDKEDSESGALFIPGAGREKPITGKIISIGVLVRDGNIKAGKGKKAVFHRGAGQNITYKKVDYLILDDNHLIGVDDYD